MKPKTFFHALIQTFSTAPYYIELLRTRFSFSLRFFVMSYACLGLIATGIFMWKDMPMYQRELNNDFDQLAAHFPAQLQVMWQNETLSLSPDQTIILPYPSLFHGQTENFPAHFIVIDPKAAKPNQDALFFVNNKTLFASAGPQNWSTVSLRDLPGFDSSFMLTKDNIAAKVVDWKKALVENTSSIEVFYFLIVTPALMLARFLSLLINSFFLFVLIRLFTRRFSLIKIIQFSLHISVVAETGRIIADQLFPQTLVPIYALIFWGFFLFIMIQLQMDKRLSKTV